MEAFLPAMFAAGLASGLHCVAMCGGIVTALADRRAIPIAPARPRKHRALLYNAGRIATYSIAGAAAGAAGAAGYAALALPAQYWLQLAVGAMLLAAALQLLGAGGWLARLEPLGLPLWSRLQPLAARLLPGDTPARAFGAGLVWGWLPCGLVYAALAAAALSGSALRGAAAMAAFGLGTLPFLLGAAWLARRLRAWRLAAAAILLGSGVYGLAHAGELGETIRRGLLCL